MHGNREIPASPKIAGPDGEGHKPNIRHARRWEVRWPRSTCEAGEQSRARPAANGVRGGKAANFRERMQNDRDPDSVPIRRVERIAARARIVKFDAKT